MAKKRGRREYKERKWKGVEESNKRESERRERTENLVMRKKPNEKMRN